MVFGLWSKVRREAMGRAWNRTFRQQIFLVKLVKKISQENSIDWLWVGTVPIAVFSRDAKIIERDVIIRCFLFLAGFYRRWWRELPSLGQRQIRDNAEQAPIAFSENRVGPWRDSFSPRYHCKLLIFPFEQPLESRSNPLSRGKIHSKINSQASIKIRKIEKKNFSRLSGRAWKSYFDRFLHR